MNKDQLENKIYTIIKEWSGSVPKKISAIPQSGSNRKYFRVKTNGLSAVVAYNPDIRENEAFTSFTHHFFSKGLPVPKLLYQSEDDPFYIVEDLGDDNLYKLLISRPSSSLDYQLSDYYKEALRELVGFQLDGHEGLDYTLCYPRAEFDEQSIQWDLNYFKYYYLKLANIHFDEQKLEEDYQLLINLLMTADRNFFMFRDFQSRNIMIHEGKLHFIDYQGGRKGPLQYDVASLLYQAKARIPENTRVELLSYYLDELEKRMSVDRKQFIKLYYAFVFIRTLQVLGAYGYRGFFERKSHFIESIPFAINNLTEILPKLEFLAEMPELKNSIDQIIHHHQSKQNYYNGHKLLVSITSFSYKKGIPEDTSGNGGGFVFDCRAIHNPGRYKEYQKLTGKDREVIDFFAKEPEMHRFIEDSFKLVDAAVQKYISRKFTHLQVNFGCTGGQHRSVYCAENLAWHLNEKFDVDILLTHREQEQ